MVRCTLPLTVALVVACGSRPDPRESPPRSGPEAKAEPEGEPDPASKQAPPQQPEGDMPESIGSVEMKADGTLVLMLRAEAPDGTVGDALFTYAPDDERYAEILAHVAPISPGESKSVAPWPAE